mmetsp:Transcript_9447/g.24480  ORF Transcript_9447/g.24480 Transcript_9447/m.24480 type:complete len:480 (+) Transcript_9447:44-1483(+)
MPPGAAAAHSAQAARVKSQEAAAAAAGNDGAISEMSSIDQSEPELIPDTLPLQSRVRTAYNTDVVQIGVAVLIFGNFLISAADKQINALPGSQAAEVFYGFELFFAVVFGIELLWNMYGLWMRYFWKSGWNVFDFIIVTITALSLSLENVPGISVLRLFRAFRVFRLFRRVDSLKLIIEGVGASMPGVANAFMILGILMGIWSIIGVEFYAPYADEEFGNFAKAMFTMWQVMTMDSWASGIARPLLYDAGQLSAAPFFISFTFVAGIVMTNVVVAILLEKYLNATQDARERKANEKRAKKAAQRVARQQSFSGSTRQSTMRKQQSGMIIPESPVPGQTKKLEKDDLIDLVLQTCTRKALTNMSKDDVISVALMLWHHPGMRESVPKEIAEGWNVTEQNKSRSILLNIMQKGLEPTAVREDVGAFGNEPNRTSTTHTAMLPPPRKAGAGAGDGADGGLGSRKTTAISSVDDEHDGAPGKI